MKFIIATLLIVSVFSAGEDCVKEKCPTQYNACVAEVFGCATKALNCKNKCGEDGVCYKECAYASGNKKLIALYECGEEFCSETDYWGLVSSECNVEQCVADFSAECLQQVNLRSVECLLGFSQRHPECDCINK